MSNPMNLSSLQWKGVELTIEEDFKINVSSSAVQSPQPVIHLYGSHFISHFISVPCTGVEYGLEWDSWCTVLYVRMLMMYMICA